MRKTSTLPNSSPDSSDFPYGGIVDQSDIATGTPVIEATYSDFIQSLWQFFRVTSTPPNGLAENTTNGFQLFKAMEEYLVPVGTIRIWPSLVSPPGWRRCDGSLRNVSEYLDLYNLIGKTFDQTVADGTFRLPNFRDRFPLGTGDTYVSMGFSAGEINHILLTNEIPAHQHNNGIADDLTSSFVYNSTTVDMPGNATKTLETGSNARTYQGKTSSVGSGLGHNNMPPFLVINYIIKAKYGEDL